MSTEALRRRHRTKSADSQKRLDERAHDRRDLQAASFFSWKDYLERPLALVLLMLASPIVAVLWLLVKCTSPGPGIYRQQRVGRHGKPFQMLKLRSMRADAEAGSGAVWSPRCDPRVTPLGRVLRKLHLDELPQLINVIKGEMSLVGPRPERPEFVQVLAGQLHGYDGRLLVKPGITGLAQVNLPPDTDLLSVAKKLVLDLEYVQSAGPWLEVRLLICTATRLVKVSTVRALGLRRRVNSSTAMSLHLAGPVAPTVAPASINGHRPDSHGHGSNGHGGPHLAKEAVDFSNTSSEPIAGPMPVPDEAIRSGPHLPR